MGIIFEIKASFYGSFDVMQRIISQNGVGGWVGGWRGWMVKPTLYCALCVYVLKTHFVLL